MSRDLALVPLVAEHHAAEHEHVTRCAAGGMYL